MLFNSQCDRAERVDVSREERGAGISLWPFVSGGSIFLEGKGNASSDRSAPATKSNLQGSPLSRGQDVGQHFRASHGTGHGCILAPRRSPTKRASSKEKRHEMVSS